MTLMHWKDWRVTTALELTDVCYVKTQEVIQEMLIRER